jgi:ADP-ribosyl-[dinitrogen reductase] hydrolase
MTDNTLDRSRVAGSLYGLLVGDALAMPAHWFYSPEKLRADYGDISGMVAPRPTHAESMVQGMSYTGTWDILHDKARYYTGHQSNTGEGLSQAEKDARRDDHGNYVGHTPDDRVHYHATLKAGQNTANGCLTRLAMRYLAEANEDGDGYDPDEYLRRLQDYMLAPPEPDNDQQLINHNDVYLDVYLRVFFTNASQGKSLRDCALTQRDSWSIGSLDGVVLAIPTIAAYAHEADWYVVGRAVEHHMLTHRSVTVTASLAVLVPLLLSLYRGTDLRTTLDEYMSKMRPPKITGRALADSYVNHHGPGNIPPNEKWRQHMELDDSETTRNLVHRMLNWDDQDVAGFRDRECSRLSTACYCEHALTTVLYLAYKYAEDPEMALLQNVRIGGHSTARGAVLGAILGAAHGVNAVPFVGELCAKESIDQEIAALISTIPSRVLIRAKNSGRATFAESS